MIYRALLSFLAVAIAVLGTVALALAISTPAHSGVVVSEDEAQKLCDDEGGCVTTSKERLKALIHEVQEKAYKAGVEAGRQAEFTRSGCNV